MTLATTIYLGLFLVGLALSFFFSGFETGSYALSAIRFRLREAEGDPAAKVLGRYMEDMPRIIATALVGTNLGNYLLTFAAFGLIAERVSASRAELLSTLLVTPFVFVFAEVVPKEIFRRHGEVLVYASARLFAFADLVFRPISAGLALVPWLLERLRLTPSDAGSLEPEGLERFSIELTRGTERGTLSPHQATMARRIMALDKRRVSNVVVPLWRVARLSIDTPLERAREAFKRTGHSRLVLYRGDANHVVGTAWIFDVCFGEKDSLAECLQEPLRLRYDTPIERAMLALRERHVAMAFVENSRGVVIGVVTLKDLVGEIVTDLHDL